ncbi:hypothetical protein NP233_g714 [Leucocoprinus birnbaumii]|uniref:Uncharacterized protein n=1 Tax=Leucocoprinus birnbaumii TaxID=56174 RepID=A0AAD5W2D9_9AGAR|nr:hypothetical protein NP233_g714 [Leucocoprinus birnbaumii]
MTNSGTTASFNDFTMLKESDTPFTFADYVSGLRYSSTVRLLRCTLPLSHQPNQQGITLLTFCTAAFSLVYNLKGSHARWILLASAVFMFGIATASVAVSLDIVFGYLMHNKANPYSLIQIRHTLYFVNNLAADALLVNISLLCDLVSFCLGVFFVSSPGELIRDRRYIYMWMGLAFNIVVTGLNAIRIWWMAREARKVHGPAGARRYYSAMVIMIESGAIYSLYVLVDQMIKTVSNKDLFILDAGLTQVVAIAPTLIIVQVGFGRQARDMEAVRANRETTEVVFTTVHSQS